MPKKKITQARQPKIKFQYVKSARHHVSHVDGAYGSVTPQGLVMACLFNEHMPIPTETTHNIIDGHKIVGKPEKSIVKEGFEREIDVTIYLVPDVARNIGNWLVEKADEAEALVEHAKKLRQDGEE